jgi:hypothetical protein
MGMKKNQEIRIGRGLAPGIRSVEGEVEAGIVTDTEAIKIGVIEVNEVIDTEAIEGGGIGKGRAVEAAKNQREIEKRRELIGRRKGMKGIRREQSVKPQERWRELRDNQHTPLLKRETGLTDHLMRRCKLSVPKNEMRQGKRERLMT